MHNNACILVTLILTLIPSNIFLKTSIKKVLHSLYDIIVNFEDVFKRLILEHSMMNNFFLIFSIHCSLKWRHFWDNETECMHKNGPAFCEIWVHTTPDRKSWKLNFNLPHEASWQMGSVIKIFGVGGGLKGVKGREGRGGGVYVC